MPRDVGANYNAFGQDSNRLIAYLAASLFGPYWVPKLPTQVFAGPPQPPRFGLPAYYQLQCLPPGFVPRKPPNFFGLPHRSYLKPPRVFDIELFDAIRFSMWFIDEGTWHCNTSNCSWQGFGYSEIITEDDADTDDHNTVKTDMQGSEEDQVSKSDEEYLADIEGDGGYNTDATREMHGFYPRVSHAFIF